MSLCVPTIRGVKPPAKAAPVDRQAAKYKRFSISGRPMRKIFERNAKGFGHVSVECKRFRSTMLKYKRFWIVRCLCFVTFVTQDLIS